MKYHAPSEVLAKNSCPRLTSAFLVAVPSTWLKSVAIYRAYTESDVSQKPLAERVGVPRQIVNKHVQRVRLKFQDWLRFQEHHKGRAFTFWTWKPKRETYQ